MVIAAGGTIEITPVTPATAYLNVINDAALTQTVRIAGYIGSITNYMSLNIHVCGAEVLSLVDATKKSIVVGFEAGAPADAIRYHSIDEATFAAYYSLAPATPCTVD